MDHLCFFCLVFVMPLCASVFCALWSPAGKGLTVSLSLSSQRNGRLLQPPLWSFLSKKMIIRVAIKFYCTKSVNVQK